MDTITYILILLLVAIMYFGIQYFDNSEKSKNNKQNLKKHILKLYKVIASLSDTEIKITAIVLGTFLGLSSAYRYGENIYYENKYSPDRVFYKTKYYDSTYDYTLGFGVLIISTGIIYLILKRIKINNQN